VSFNYRDGLPREIGCTLPRQTLSLDGEGWVGVVAPQYHRLNEEHPIPGSSSLYTNRDMLIFVSGLAEA
jgi:hypothetical protein